MVTGSANSGLFNNWWAPAKSLSGFFVAFFQNCQYIFSNTNIYNILSRLDWMPDFQLQCLLVAPNSESEVITEVEKISLMGL